MNRRNALGHLLALSTLPIVSRSGQAEEAFPNKSIRMIVPFPAGNVVDVHVRKIAPHLATLLGQAVVIDNRPGASGTIGVSLGAQAKPDGYTVTVGTSSNLAASPALGVKLSYDPIKDFQPITQYSRTGILLIANPSLGVSSMKELIALAKQKPKQINYGTAGPTGIGRLACELLQHEAGIELTNIPYKTPVLSAVLGNEVPLGWDFSITSTPHILAGKLKALVTTGNKRIGTLPNVPTVSEVGLPGAEIYGWGGFLVPTGTPGAIVTKLNDAIRSVLQKSDIRGMLDNEGGEVVSGSPEEFRAYIAAEKARFARIIQRAGIQADKD